MYKATKCFLLTLLLLSPAASGSAADQRVGVRLLDASPACTARRLGQVTVSVGDLTPDPRSGATPPGVSYKKAFAKLQQAAAEKGGNAVVLRNHQASYFSRGGRRPRRPTYVSLVGAVVELRDQEAPCSLSFLDPREFERNAMARRRENVTVDAGVSF